jgi:hypothetical protein
VSCIYYVLIYMLLSFCGTAIALCLLAPRDHNERKTDF